MTHYNEEYEKEAEQREPEIILERFKIVEDLPGVLDIQFDGVTISIDTLVKVANQLATALNDRGCTFQVVKDETN